MTILAIFALWILFNGRFTLEVALFGVPISLAVYMLVRKHISPGFGPKQEWQLMKRLPKIVSYLVLLVKEIVAANIQVLRFVLSSREETIPHMAVFETKLKSTGARVVLADSITLTPGTITVSLEDNRYVVHCLDESLADGLEDSLFEKRLLALEGAKEASDA